MLATMLSAWEGDDIPPRLLRAYDDARWADDLAHRGVLMLNKFQRLHDLDEARADTSEGSASHKVPGMVRRVAFGLDGGPAREIPPVDGHINFHGEWANAAYAFCCSLPAVDPVLQAEKFGSHLVEIHDGRAFASELLSACRGVEVDGRGWFFATAFAVSYNKGGILSEHEARSDRAYFASKPPSHSGECEFRFVFVAQAVGSRAPSSIPLTLARSEAWCRRLTH